MTENTILLNVERYNKLRDFYKGINEGKFVSISHYDYTIYYDKESQVLLNLKNQIKELDKELNTYKKPNDEKTIDDVKKMSLWQFFKWRNKKQ